MSISALQNLGLFSNRPNAPYHPGSSASANAFQASLGTQREVFAIRRGSENARYQAAANLHREPNLELRNSLTVALLQDPSARVRSVAAARIAYMSEGQQLDTAVNIASRSSNPNIRYHAVANTHKVTNSNIQNRVVIQGLNDTSGRTRSLAAQRMAYLDRGASLDRAVNIASRSNNPDIRYYAVANTHKVTNPNLQNRVILDGLNDPSARTRALAAQRIAYMETGHARDRATHIAAHSGSADVRYQAGVNSHQVSRDRLRSHIILSLTRDSDPKVQRIAAARIAYMNNGPHLDRAVLAAAQSPDSQTRGYAANYLNRVGNPHIRFRAEQHLANPSRIASYSPQQSYGYSRSVRPVVEGLTTIANMLLNELNQGGRFNNPFQYNRFSNSQSPFVQINNFYNNTYDPTHPANVSSNHNFNNIHFNNFNFNSFNNRGSFGQSNSFLPPQNNQSVFSFVESQRARMNFIHSRASSPLSFVAGGRPIS